MAAQPPVDQTTAQSAADQTTADAPQADQSPCDIVVSRGAYVTANDADLFTPERPYLSGFAPQGRYYAGDSTFTYGQDGALRDCVSTNGTDGCVNADGTAAGADGFNRSSTRYLAVPVER